MAEVLTETAHAKLNLALHVLARRDDGYHLLESLVAFAGFGDIVSLDLAGQPGLTSSGTFAAGLGTGADNLILRAQEAFLARFPRAKPGAFHLEKTLPVASGIGGGSADAAAALRLLARAHGIALDHSGLMESAASLGADVPVCLASQARIMRGIGHDLDPPITLPPCGLVLVNPKAPVETRAVFARLGLRSGAKHTSPPLPVLTQRPEREALLAMMHASQNDLQPPAIALCPLIQDVLGSLSSEPDCLIARMSGSGATCFALTKDEISACKMAQRLHRAHPHWWVAAGMLV